MSEALVSCCLSSVLVRMPRWSVDECCVVASEGLGAEPSGYCLLLAISGMP